MSLGLPGKGRRSIPMIRSLMWSSLASVRPKLPLMPVTITAGRMMRPCITRRSPEHVLAVAQALLEHRLDRRLHLVDLAVELGVIVVGAASEGHRVPEIDAILGRQRQGQAGRGDREDR